MELALTRVEATAMRRSTAVIWNAHLETALIAIEKLNVRIHTLDSMKSLDFSCRCLALRWPSPSESAFEKVASVPH